ncbi:sporulation protein YunB [Paenibacillus wynnii]|uniref:sporulation protein YunB n=1 Tax=Paenibacillus wynnii TaxID=268407 RepID=UPI0027917EFC|nr:sporulation protein YunB [Paenibacillus wynnii]MDQ0193832.1 sporulation protein YunB [Paenibacillus wynnii]
MARTKKWGSRIRIPRFSWDGIPTGRKSAFKARRSSTGKKFYGGRFEAKRQKRKLWGSRKEGTFTAPNLSKRKPRSRRKLWLIVSLLLLLAALQSIRYVERHLKPPIVHLAQIRVKQIATESINKAITSQVANGGNAEQLIDWKTDKNGKISGFMLNYGEHMRITSQAAEVIQTTLQQLHNKKEYIPLGQALGSPLIASFGPDIPIKIEPQGAVKVELNTRQQNAGINMILVEVFIHIVTEVAVVIPFDIEPQIVDTEIPVSYLMVVGDVPMYYYDNQGQPVGDNGISAPGISIPGLQKEKDGTTEGSVTSTAEPETVPEPEKAGNAVSEEISSTE